MNYNKFTEINKDFPQFYSQTDYDRFIIVHLYSHLCVSCRSPKFQLYGTYARHIYFSKDTHTIILMTRVKCKSCGRTQVILPPDIIPFKRYCIQSIIGFIHTCNTSFYAACQLYALPKSYFKYIMLQFEKWHQLGVETLNAQLPPPDIIAFSKEYQKQFGYTFMQII